MTQEQGLPTRKHPCWISAFLEYTKGVPSPETFRLWSAINAVAGALERRVWIRSAGGDLYPNLFVLLVGPPGVGKDQSINPVRELWAKTGRLNIAPMSMTHKGLVDQLADVASAKTFLDPNSKAMVKYHSMLVAVPELGVFVPGHDLAFLSTLNDLYNCGPSYDERSRTRGEALHIDNPHVHILSGTQPKYIGALFPEEAYGMGFTSRIIMVYAGAPVKVKLFASEHKNRRLHDTLLEDLISISRLTGQFVVSDDAIEYLEHWHAVESEKDKPTHTKLQHYSTRRVMHLMKLAMVRSVSTSNNLIITLDDIKWAKNVLLEAESLMPEIFKEITSGGNAGEIEEAFHFIMRIYNMNGQKPVAEHRLIHFLASRIPVNQINFIIDTMLRSQMIEEVSANAGLNIPAAMNKNRLFVPRELNKYE